MITFIGEYTCKVDAKGRIMFPSAFKKQLPVGSPDRLVVKRDVFEPCLILYPLEEWERQNKIIRSRTNPFNQEHARFLRMFYHGTAEIVLDSSNRMLLPRRLLEHAKIGSEVVLAGQYGRIEIWPSERYDEVSRAGEDFISIAEKLLGGTFNDLESE